jgi:hypothetical protein
MPPNPTSPQPSPKGEGGRGGIPPTPKGEQEILVLISFIIFLLNKIYTRQN